MRLRTINFFAFLTANAFCILAFFYFSLPSGIVYQAKERGIEDNEIVQNFSALPSTKKTNRLVWNRDKLIMKYLPDSELIWSEGRFVTKKGLDLERELKKGEGPYSLQLDRKILQEIEKREKEKEEIFAAEQAESPVELRFSSLEKTLSGREFFSPGVKKITVRRTRSVESLNELSSQEIEEFNNQTEIEVSEETNTPGEDPSLVGPSHNEVLKSPLLRFHNISDATIELENLSSGESEKVEHGTLYLADGPYRYRFQWKGKKFSDWIFFRVEADNKSVERKRL